jgi:hypothetical protein
VKLTGENRSTRRKTCPSATFSTTNPTWTDPGSNPGLGGGRPAANRLSHGTATQNSALVGVTFLCHSARYGQCKMFRSFTVTKYNK